MAYHKQYKVLDYPQINNSKDPKLILLQHLSDDMKLFEEFNALFQWRSNGVKNTFNCLEVEYQLPMLILRYFLPCH